MLPTQRDSVLQTRGILLGDFHRDGGVWQYVEFVDGLGERSSTRHKGNARGLLVNYGLAADLTAADEMLAWAWASATAIQLPNTPTKFAGQLVPPPSYTGRFRNQPRLGMIGEIRDMLPQLWARDRFDQAKEIMGGIHQDDFTGVDDGTVCRIWLDLKQALVM